MQSDQIKIGCQTFTWEMLGPTWQGTPDDLLASIASAGYAGLEITDSMIGHYAIDPMGFAAALGQQGLQLVAFAFGSASGFTVADELENDLESMRRWLGFAAHFPCALVSIGSATVVSTDRPRDEKFEIAADFYNKAAALGATAGVDVAIHPSSHHNTLLYDRADYDRLFSLLDAASVGWVPDTGHILRGHEDLLDTLRAYRDRIRYVHLKDADETGRWAMLGAGCCDTVQVIELASAAPRFNGWVVLEEESDEAANDPDTAVRINRQTLKALGY